MQETQKPKKGMQRKAVHFASFLFFSFLFFSFLLINNVTYGQVRVKERIELETKKTLNNFQWTNYVGDGWAEDEDRDGKLYRFLINTEPLTRGGHIYIYKPYFIYDNLYQIYINDVPITKEGLVGYFNQGERINIFISDSLNTRQDYLMNLYFQTDNRCSNKTYGIWVVSPRPWYPQLELEFIASGPSIYDINKEDPFLIPSDGYLISDIDVNSEKESYFNLNKNNINEYYNLRNYNQGILKKVKKGDVINTSIIRDGDEIYPNIYRRLKEVRSGDYTYWDDYAHYIKGGDCSFDIKAKFRHLAIDTTKNPILIAKFSKSQMQKGDIVDIVIKKKLPNGAFENFPTDTEFEIGVVNGCEYGEILTNNGGKGIYFEKVNQPIRYEVKSDSIPSNAKVKIKLGVYTYDIYPENPEDIYDITLRFEDSEGGGDPTSANKDNDELKKHQKQTNQNMDNLFCVGGFLSLNRTNFSGVIENLECDCNGNLLNTVPEIEVAEPKIKYDDCPDSLKNSTGYFTPQIKLDDLYNEKEVDVCYDNTNKKWQTGYNDKMILNSKINYCQNNLNSLKLIKNTNDLLYHINNMPNDSLKLEKVKELIITLWGHTLYEVEFYDQINNYYLFESLQIHEYEHYQDYIKGVDIVKKRLGGWEKLANNFYKKDMPSNTNCNEMLIWAKNHYKNKLALNFINVFANYWKKDYLKKSENNNSEHPDVELEIDKRETNKAKIAEYQKYLFTIYKQLISTQFNDPRYPGMKTIGDFYTGDFTDLKDKLGVN